MRGGRASRNHMDVRFLSSARRMGRMRGIGGQPHMAYGPRAYGPIGVLSLLAYWPMPTEAYY